MFRFTFLKGVAARFAENVSLMATWFAGGADRS